MSTEQVKPGDLAIVVNCTLYPEDNNGLLVRVMREVPLGPVECEGQAFYIERKSFLVESLGPPIAALSPHMGKEFFQRSPFSACKLIPIRTPPGQDETLRWADVPRNDYADAGFMPLGD